MGSLPILQQMDFIIYEIKIQWLVAHAIIRSNYATLFIHIPIVLININLPTRYFFAISRSYNDDNTDEHSSYSNHNVTKGLKSHFCFPYAKNMRYVSDAIIDRNKNTETLIAILATSFTCRFIGAFSFLSFLPKIVRTSP
jgi:hypothetical protein